MSTNKIIREVWLNTVVSRYRFSNFSNKKIESEIISFIRQMQEKIEAKQKIEDGMLFRQIIELILTRSIFIESVKIDKFLDYYYDNLPGSVSNFLFSLKHTIDKGMKINKRSKQAIFKSIIRNSVKSYNKKKRDYYFNTILATLTKAWSSDIGEYMYLNTRKAVINIAKIDKYKIYTIGSLYLYPDDVVSSKDDLLGTLILCLKASAQYLKPQDIENEFLKYVNNENKILSRLAIYFATIHYNLLRSNIIKIENPLNKWHLYADTLFMFKENISIMSADEFNVYESWINTAVFNSTHSSEYQKANRLSALSILNEYIKTKSILTDKKSTKNKLMSNEDERLANQLNDKYRVFSDRNKDIMMSFEPYTPQISNELIENLNFSMFIKKINKSDLTSRFDSEGVRMAMETYFENNSETVANYIDEIFKFDNIYINMAIDKILNSNNPNFVKVKLVLIEKAIRYLKQNEHLDLIRTIVWWLDKEENIKEENLLEVYKICIDLVDTTIEIKWPSVFDNISFPFSMLINNMLYTAIQLSIQVYYKLNPDDINIVDHLEKWLNIEYNKPIVKAAFAYYISYLKTIVYEWYLVNKESIFDNDIENINLSLVSYIANLSQNHWELNSNIEIIEKFISFDFDKSDEIYSFKKTLIENIIINKRIINNGSFFDIAIRKVDNDILVDIINSFIYKISNHPEQQEDIHDDLKTIINAMNKSNEGSDILIDRLLEFISVSENDVSYVFSYMIELAEYSDLYFDEEVMDNFKGLINKYDGFAFKLLEKLTYDKPRNIFPFEYEKIVDLLKELYKKNHLRENVIRLANDLGKYNPNYYMFAKDLGSN